MITITAARATFRPVSDEGIGGLVGPPELGAGMGGRLGGAALGHPVAGGEVAAASNSGRSKRVVAKSSAKGLADPKRGRSDAVESSAWTLEVRGPPAQGGAPVSPDEPFHGRGSGDGPFRACSPVLPASGPHASGGGGAGPLPDHAEA